MRLWSWVCMGVCLSCGPTRGNADSGGHGGSSAANAGSDGLGGSTTDGGSTAASVSDDTGGSSGSVDAGGDTDSGGDVDSGVTIPACGLAIALDMCCNQPLPATADEVMADACLVAWPYDEAELPEGLLEMCAALQPEVCGVVDCGTSPPASDHVEIDEAGACITVCPEQQSIAYASPRCGVPPPIQMCLPPPPPCAMDFCSCEGETIVGCGHLYEPFAHEGPCR